MELFNGTERLKRISKEIDESLGLKKPEPIIEKIELERVVERREVAPIVTQPEGPLYALCRCTPNGLKSIVFFGLTLKQAKEKYKYYNDKEERKRRNIAYERHEKGLEYKPEPDEIVFFDYIHQEKLEQRSPYYNPKEIMITNA